MLNNVNNILKAFIPADKQIASAFLQTLSLLEDSTYIELLTKEETANILSQNAIIEDIIFIFIKHQIYLCSDYVDYQQYLFVICCFANDNAVSYLTFITQKYIKENRIEELRVLSFILYMLSDFIRLSPIVCLIDKYFYQQRIIVHQNILNEKVHKEMDILIKLAEPLHQYSFIDSVFKHHSEAKDVKELAALCGYSYSTFKRLFSEHFHTSPYKWILKQRKEQVMYLIQFSKFLPFEIADRCNFSSASNFNSFCKKYLGDTPGNLITRFRQF